MQHNLLIQFRFTKEELSSPKGSPSGCRSVV
jgi:hypothetical protein